jgi:hypothetical protein
MTTGDALVYFGAVVISLVLVGYNRWYLGGRTEAGLARPGAAKQWASGSSASGPDNRSAREWRSSATLRTS